MKTQNKIWQVIALTLTATLGACGGNNTPVPYGPNNYNYGYGAGMGSCGIPTGTKDKTVIGTLQGGATLTLDIYTQPSGSIAAIGSINIPNLASLYQLGYGSTTAVGTASSFQQCVSSNGSVGTIDRTSTYQNIELALQGAGVYIELGSRYGIPTYITGDAIEGTMYIELQGQAPTTFTMARP